MALLTKADILEANDIQTRDVPVPEWGGEVRIKGMSGTERDAYESGVWHDGVADMTNIRARLVAACAVDGMGRLLFTQDDVLALGEKSAAALDRCADAARDLSGLGKEDLAKLQGNSEAGPAGDSTSSSPLDSAAPSESSSPELTPES